MKCELCEERPFVPEHHWDGKEIFLENLSEEMREKYLRLEEKRDEPLPLCVQCHNRIHGNDADWCTIKTLYRFRKKLIEHRKAAENRARSLKAYELDVSVFEEIKDKVREKIKEIESLLEEPVHQHELWKWLDEVTGVAEVNAAGLIAKIRDISNFDTSSKIWSYLGLIPEKEFDPEKSNFDSYEQYRQATKDGRTLAVYEIGDQFIKQGDKSFYRQFYDKRREKAEREEKFGDPDAKYQKGKKKGQYKNRGHYYNDARRVATKIFLSHLYEVWRRIEGLETREPYIMKKEMHHYIKPPHLDAIQ